MADTGTTVQMLEPPARLQLPLFDYGLFKPDQLAYERVLGQAASDSRPARLPSGGLRYRDGLPLLDPDGATGVDGVLITFDPGSEAPAYQAVCAFAPRQHYRWLSIEVALDGERTVAANALLGRHPERGSTEEWFTSWSAADEPVFGFGLHLVRAQALEHGREPFPTVGPEAATWERFFGLQAAHLLLWSAVERFSALALGPAEPALARLWRLGDDQRFKESVLAAGVLPSRKTPDSRDPQRWRRVRDDGTGAMYSWEALRHTLGHPGATAWQDGVTLRRVVVELHDTFRLLLLSCLPEVARTWKELDPGGADHRWLLRPVVSPEGLA